MACAAALSHCCCGDDSMHAQRGIPSVHNVPTVHETAWRSHRLVGQWQVRSKRLGMLEQVRWVKESTCRQSKGPAATSSTFASNRY
jgi:hypothetical protein